MAPATLTMIASGPAPIKPSIAAVTVTIPIAAHPRGEMIWLMFLV